jgi:HPt (histidine-containing phosphotransfer) domain-containing protein
VDMLTMQGEGSPADDREILDGAILDELRNIGGNTALFNRVLELFASRVPQAVEKVAALATSSDLSALADAAHALKSMCANIGAHHAVGACHDLELAARTSKEFDAGEKTANIIREVRRVMRAVDGLRAA